MYVFFRMELVNEKKKKRIKLLPPLSVLCTFAIEIFSLFFVVYTIIFWSAFRETM